MINNKLPLHRDNMRSLDPFPLAPQKYAKLWVGLKALIHVVFFGFENKCVKNDEKKASLEVK